MSPCVLLNVHLPSLVDFNAHPQAPLGTRVLPSDPIAPTSRPNYHLEIEPHLPYSWQGILLPSIALLVNYTMFQVLRPADQRDGTCTLESATPRGGPITATRLACLRCREKKV